MVMKALTAALIGWGMLGAAHAFVALPSPRTEEPPTCPPTGWEYRWVAPEYRLVEARVWVGERREWVTECVEVRPGEWAEVRREAVRPAHWETRMRRELVRGGYWALVRIEDPICPVPPSPMPRPLARTADGTVGVEGYSRVGGENLSKFSGLSEWPK